MKVCRQSLTALVLLSFLVPLFAQEAASEDGHAERSVSLELEGKSFQGRIRAKGILGLFSVRGTLSFKDGLMIWSAKGSEDSAPYESEERDGVLVFTSHITAEGETYVDWSGTYDGASVSKVKAVWTRTEEEDFIHDLLLPDVVTLVFKQDKD